MYDKKGDENILNSEEEVFAVGGEGEVITIGVRERDKVANCFQCVGKKGNTSCGTC